MGWGWVLGGVREGQGLGGREASRVGSMVGSRYELGFLVVSI